MMEPDFYVARTPRPRSTRSPSSDELDLFASAVGDGGPKETKGATHTSPADLDNAGRDADASVSGVGGPVLQQSERVAEVHASLSDSARRWIDLGKPVAVAVAKARGTVTAETFRAEASKRGKLPPETDQRSLCWIPVMFAELCKEGHLQKRRRSDGSVVKEYSKVQSNDQVVYEPRSRKAAA